ncbi:zinc finger, C3HC4 type (RING finger) protein [Medicago truncatula]|uniref:RING-type E3 ubiquitin transferase n=1 Tax=Medicago truncatula TaxID=3880 RepID=G7JQ82_MEDTR|nr:zinc finger, C3HC4 type (RING finger) protein [Medicago truncatula]
MLLEIEDMSYEEFIALGERICCFSYDVQEIDACIICKIEFKDQKKIEIPQCKHEYHVDCIKNWLVIKNECHIFKTEAYTSTKNDT